MAKPSPQQQEPPRIYRGPVRRIRAVVSDGVWRVLKQVTVERMSLPANWEPDESRLARSNYYEVVAEDGTAYRRHIKDPTETSIELFDRDAIRRAVLERDVIVDILAPEAQPIDKIRLVVGGKDLPLKEGRKKPHTNGYRVPKSSPAGKRGKRGGKDGNR